MMNVVEIFNERKIILDDTIGSYTITPMSCGKFIQFQTYTTLL